MDNTTNALLLVIAMTLGSIVGIVLLRNRRIRLLEQQLESAKPNPSEWSADQLALAVCTWHAHQDAETQRACPIWIVNVDSASRDLVNAMITAWNRRHAPMIVPLQSATPEIEPFYPNPETVRVFRRVTGEIERRELAMAAITNAQRFVHATPQRDIALSIELNPIGEITGVHVQCVSACSPSQVAPGLPGSLNLPNHDNTGDVAA